MRVYEYECPACGRFERKYRIDVDRPRILPCPVCQGPAKTVISRVKPPVWWVGYPFLERDGVK